MVFSWSLYELYSKQAEKAWLDRSEKTAEWLTTTIIAWFEESQLSMIALATLAENSEHLSISEFQGAFESLEERSSAFFIDSSYLLSKKADGWNVSNEAGNLALDTDLLQHEFESLSRFAESRPGRIVLGEPFPIGDGGDGILLAIYTDFGKEEYLLCALLDATTMMNSLAQLHVPEGFSLRVQAAYPQSGRNIVLYDRHQSNQGEIFFNKHMSASVELLFHWKVSRNYLGGPESNLPRTILVLGLLTTILVSLVLLAFARVNRQVQREVQKITKDILEKNRQLWKLVVWPKKPI